MTLVLRYQWTTYQTIFDIGQEKALGPGGYSSCFFKKSWNIVGYDVCQAIKELFQSGCLPKKINHTVIYLIPKSSYSSTVGDYRYIAYCNVVYKVISKILTGRMASILPVITDEAQSAIVEGRRMLENIHLA